MGTPEFAAPSLERLCDHGYAPAAVVTGADKPQGRGRRTLPTPVKAAALARGIPALLQPLSLRDEAFVGALKALEPDLFVVVAFRILPPEVFTLPRLGAFNLHGSLLPRYRGAAPIHRAVMAGETETGVTTFFLREQVDTGNMILQKRMPIGPDETTGEVHDRMMQLGADAVLETVRLIERGQAHAAPQDDALATPAPKLFKEDGRIPWEQSAAAVHNHIRGLSPHPGAWTLHAGAPLKVFRSARAEGAGRPGEVLAGGPRLVVACGAGAVEALEVQQEGRRRLPAEAFLRGYALPPGTLLGS